MERHKTIFTIFIIGCVICFLYGSKKIYNYYSWAEERCAISTPDPIYDDSLKVIIIGDSWATYHHDNDTILSSILQKVLSKPVCVISSGIIGAKTKTIYEQMFDTITSTGTHKLISGQPDYCIISAGINDAVAKLGVRNYCYHYNLIIRYLLSSGIKPIVLDMPDVGYNDVYKRESIIANIRHQISSWYTNAPMWNYEDYRKELHQRIYQDEIKNRIIYIPSREWNPKGFEDPRDLYLEDHIHLNKKGYHLLDSCIAAHIYSDYKSIRDSL